MWVFCPFPENLRSYRLSENDRRPFFGTHNDISNNPKTTDIKFLNLDKFEVTILLRKSEGIKGLPKFTETIRWVPPLDYPFLFVRYSSVIQGPTKTDLLALKVSTIDCGSNGSVRYVVGHCVFGSIFLSASPRTGVLMGASELWSNLAIC